MIFSANIEVFEGGNANEKTLYVGLDVHKDTIAVAVAEDGRGGKIRFHGTIVNSADAVSTHGQAGIGAERTVQRQIDKARPVDQNR